MPYSPVAEVNPGGPMIPASGVARPIVLPVGGGASSTDVVVVSLANPQAPSVVNTFSFQGQEQAARLINGQVVLTLTSQAAAALGLRQRRVPCRAEGRNNCKPGHYRVFQGFGLAAFHHRDDWTG